MNEFKFQTIYSRHREFPLNETNKKLDRRSQRSTNCHFAEGHSNANNLSNKKIIDAENQT